MKRLLVLIVCLGWLVPVHGQSGDILDLEALLGGGKKSTPEELRAAGQQIVKQVSKLRQLSVKSSIQMDVQSKEQIRAYVEKRLKEEIKDEEMQGQEWALKCLGLLPEDYPLREKIVALYEEQIAGYYDPFDKKFYIADWIPLSMQAPIMAHELTHALQDQHFDLRPYLSPIKEHSDATTARQAVVEGDAVLTMMQYSFSAMGLDVDQIGNVSGAIRQALELSNSKYPVFGSAPVYLRESLMFPYTAGADFALARKHQGGWKHVSAVFSNLPKSTEQIIHPEKYPSDAPQPIDLAGLAKALPRGWKEVHTDVLGEFGVQLLFVSKPGGAAGVRAAAGWDGDRYRAYRAPGNRTVVVHRSVWDTEKDAKEFEVALKTYTASLSVASPVIARKGDQVLWIVGEPDGKTAKKLAKAAWK